MRLPQKVVNCHGGNNNYSVYFLFLFLLIILPVIVINIQFIVQKGAFLFLPSNVEVYQNKSTTTTSTTTTTTTNWQQREETLRFDESLLNTTVPTQNNLTTTTTVPTNSTITPTTTLSSSTTILSPTDVDTTDAIITLCTRAQIRNGTWTKTVVEGGAPYQPTFRWHRTCERRRRRDDGKFNYSLPWKTFKWEPVDATTGTCSFSEWKASDFCELFAFTGSTTSTNDDGGDDDYGGNRTEGGGTTPRPTVTIAFLGDSTTFQQFSSLSLLLGEYIQGHEQQVSIKKKIDIVRKPCGGNVTLSYRRDDTLHRLPTVIAEMQPDVIVLNTGIHYHPDPLYQQIMTQTLQELQGWQTSCQQQQQNQHNNNGSRMGRLRFCLPVLRTTMPGHPFCMNYTTPSESLPDMEQLIHTHSNYEGENNNFFWWDVQRQNQQFLLEAFATSTLSPYDIIDGYDLNVLRPDRHQSEKDCLHYCLPGPPDVLNQILLHILRRRRRRAAFAV